jgi:type VI secretion system protein ImpG
VDGIRRVSSSPTTRRLGGADRAAFARGLKMRITLDDAAFENGRMYLFASVLERFLSEFASINTFIETTFDSPELGDFAHWAPRLGLRPTI